MRDDKLKKYLRKKYYKDDRKVVTIYIESEKKLYNTLDGMKDTLNSEVTDYLNRSVETILPANRVEIKVECSKEVDLANFQKCLKIHYGIENLNYARIKKLVTRKKRILLIIAAFVLLSLYFDNTFLLEVRNFIITLSIWEYIDMILGSSEEDEIEEYVSKLLEDAKVI